MKISELFKNLYCYDIINKIIISDEIIMDIEIINSNSYIQLNENILYIIEDNMLKNLSCKKDLIYNFLIIKENETIQDQDNEYKYNVIFLSSTADSKAVYHELTTILSQAILTKLKIQELYSLLSLDEYLEPLLDKAFELLGNPIQCSDYSHKIIGERSKEESFKLAAIWDRASELGYVGDDIIDDKFLNNVKRMNETKDSITTIRDGKKIVLFPIFINNYYMGCIAVLEEYKKIQEGDLEILKIASKIISIKFTEKNLINSEEGNYYGSILEDLIEQRIKNNKDLQSRLKTRNWKQRKCYRIILIKCKDYSTEYIRYIKRNISNIWHDLKIMPYNDYVLILEEFESDVGLHKEVINYITQSNLTVGISNIYKELLNTHTSYIQAKKSLYYNDILHLKQKINYYTDYQFFDFLHEIRNNVNCENFYHRIVMDIDEYDRLHNTEFGKTLFEYLKSDKSILKTCSNMHLHKNTVNYRINKIKEIFDINFENTLECFFIGLSFMIKNLSEQIDG